MDVRHLRMALDAARMTIWDTAIHDGTVYNSTVSWQCSGQCLLGLPPGRLTQPFVDFLSYVHPDDRDALATIMQEAVDAGTGYEVEYRVVWDDGSLHWLAAKAHMHCDAHGAPVGTLGVVWDITDRKLAEQASARDREMATVTLRAIGEGVITIDPHGKTEYLNRTAEQLTGWANDEARGQDIAITLHLTSEAGEPIAEHVALRCLRLRQTVAPASDN